jgi:hypothetical protein
VRTPVETQPSSPFDPDACCLADGDQGTLGLDRAVAFERLDRQRHGRSLRCQHDRQEIVGEREHELLLHYTHTVMMTVSQTAMSNGAYSVEERLARWILMAHDRRHGRSLRCQHDRQEIVGEREIVALQPVVRHQDPTVRDRGMLCDLAGSSYGPAEATYERLIGPFRKRRSYVASAGP